MKIMRLIAFCTVLVCLSSCGRPKWHTLSDGNKFYGKLDGGKSYYWEGQSIGNLPDGSNNSTCLLPDGEGYLVSMKSNGKVGKKQKMTLYYGTDSKKYPYPSIQSGKFHGKVKKTKNGAVPKKGFGVLIQEDIVSCGTFKKGQLDGKEIVVFKNKVVIYYGEYKNGLRNGEGKEYKGGELYYSGSWKNNMKDGKGILYLNGSVQYDGKWKDDSPTKDIIFE